MADGVTDEQRTAARVFGWFARLSVPLHSIRTLVPRLVVVGDGRYVTYNCRTLYH